MSRLLNYQADRIELVLASHKVAARVMGGKVTPRLVRYELTAPLGVRIKRIAALSEEIALSLGASSCRVFRQSGQMQVEVPRPDAKPVRLMPLCKRLAELSSRGRGAIPPLTAVLGLDHEGVPLLLRLPSPNVAHVLIAGTTGSGKTALARSIVASLAMHNCQRDLQMVLVDPKGRGLLPFQGLPHLMAPVVMRVEDTLPLLERVVAEMERRDAEGRSDPRLVVVLDEMADLVQVGGKPMEALLTRLTQRGREAGIHLVACAQKPTAAVIGGLVKSNFPVRLVGSVACPEDAKVATGIARTGAEQLLGQGDFLVVAKGEVTRMQAAYIEPAELEELVTRLGNGTKPLVLAATGTDGRRGTVRAPGAQFRDRLRARMKLIKSKTETDEHGANGQGLGV